MGLVFNLTYGNAFPIFRTANLSSYANRLTNLTSYCNLPKLISYGSGQMVVFNAET